MIDVGGVGLRTLIPTSTATRLPEIGEVVRLFTYLNVQEDASPSTASPAGRSCSSSSSSWLSGASARPRPWPSSPVRGGHPAGGHRRENTAALRRIPGVGARLAAQIVLDLKDKMGPLPLPARRGPRERARGTGRCWPG